MELTFVLTIVLVIGIILVGYVVMRKLPQLRMIDPTTHKEASSKQLKHDIMRTRLERVGGKQFSDVNKKLLTPMREGFQNMVRRVAGKLTAVERRYKEAQKDSRSGGYSKEELEAMVEEARALVENDEFGAAEKKFIEVISYDPKHIPAYEYLGRLYLKNKQYDLARETFTFLLKLSPKDASVTTSLGEVEEALGHDDKAMAFYKEAVKISPNNPKYLDFLIESAIKNEEVVEATEALSRLQEVNPDNQKIAVFEEQIGDLRQAIKAGK